MATPRDTLMAELLREEVAEFEASKGKGKGKPFPDSSSDEDDMGSKGKGKGKGDREQLRREALELWSGLSYRLEMDMSSGGSRVIFTEPMSKLGALFVVLDDSSNCKTLVEKNQWTKLDSFVTWCGWMEANAAGNEKVQGFFDNALQWATERALAESVDLLSKGRVS